MGKPTSVLTRPERRPQPVPVEVDDSELIADAYEEALFALLFRLEHLRDGILATLANNRLSPALTLACELMDQVARFADDHCALATEAEMAEPAARATAFRETLAPLRGGAQPALIPTRECLLTLHEAVFSAFVVFTNRFPTAPSGRGWVEVAATFTVDLKRSIEDSLPLPRE